jgi:hypothetical protein
MKYYTLRHKLWDDSIMDEKSEGKKVYPMANGDKISNGNGLLSKSGELGKIYFENYVDDAPIFDYFYLYNSSYQKEYDWILLDAYSYVGQNIPSARGFLVSKKLKEILEQFNIAQPFRFYESRLMYQGEKLEYYIFHLAQNEWKEFNYEKSTFYKGNEKLNVKVTSNREFKKLIKSEPNIQMNLALKNQYDIFYFSQFNYVISETLKNRLEKLNSSSFEFTELKNVNFIFTNKPA